MVKFHYMKRLIIFLAATIIALLSGVAVFLWSGETPAELEERGRQLGEQIKEVGAKGKQHIEQARDTIKKMPITPRSGPADGGTAMPSLKKPDEPTSNRAGGVSRPAPESRNPAKREKPPATAPEPPMEKISKKDREKLEGILGE